MAKQSTNNKSSAMKETEYLLRSPANAARLARGMNEIESLINDGQVLHLTKEDTQVFIEAFLNPPEPTAALKKALRRHKKATQGNNRR